MIQHLPSILVVLASKSSTTNNNNKNEGKRGEGEKKREREQERRKERNKERRSNERKKRTDFCCYERKRNLSKVCVCIRSWQTSAGLEELVGGLAPRNQTPNLTVGTSMAAPEWHCFEPQCSAQGQGHCCQPSPPLVWLLLACCHRHRTEETHQLLPSPHELQIPSPECEIWQNP